MAQLSSRLKIAIFAGVVAAPLLALAVLGAVAPYGQRPHPGFPKARALAIAKQGAFDQLGKALLDRSIVTREAIRLKYALDYDVSRYVDTDLVVSGRGDWLYYKDDFSRNTVCVGRSRMAAAMAQIDLMTDLAMAAGLQMFVSMSPDKASIYPEYTHPMAEHYWSCKGQSGGQLLWFMGAEAPRMIYHGAPLWTEKRRTSGDNLFWHQDTHWTPLGAALARRQLYETVLGTPAVPVPPPRLTGEKVARETDMGNLMLLLPDHEMYETIDPEVEAQVSEIYAATPSPRTAMIADSFYTVAPFNDPKVFPGLVERHIDAPDAGDAISNVDTVIINSVERALIGRVEMGIFNWSSSFGKALLARNAATAQGCANFRPATLDSIPAVIEGSLPCIRLTVEGANMEIAFPPHEEGSSVPRTVRQTLAPGPQVLTYVLPGYVVGRGLVVRGATVLSVETGEIPQPYLSRYQYLREIPGTRLAFPDLTP